MLGTPRLDFLIIGAQKAGTTSLWRYLSDNPKIRMPPHKEAPFFTEATYPDGYRAYMRALFKRVPRDARAGDASPIYMLGANGLSVDDIAARIHATVPGVRLVALLRDPLPRARSSHRMLVREQSETRSFAAAVREQLEPDALAHARRDATPANSYVVAGEYGRILEAYLEHFARDQLLVEFTADLERDPAGVVARVCEHIGVAPHQSPQLGERFYPGGPRRVDARAEAELKRYLEEHVWPRMRYADQHRESFEFWFRLWNAVPEPPADEIDPALAAELRAHYAEDDRRLELIAGRPLPWSAKA